MSLPPFAITFAGYSIRWSLVFACNCADKEKGRRRWGFGNEFKLEANGMTEVSSAQ